MSKVGGNTKVETARIATNVQLYDHLWTNEWQDMERFNPTARHLERIIARAVRQVQAVSSLVDVGCGMGVNVKRIRSHFPEMDLTGTDLSPSILKIAESYAGTGPRIDYAVLDIAKGSLHRNFDVVLCNQVLEHIEDDRAAIRNLARMSRRYVLVTVPSGIYNSTSKLNGHHRHYGVPELRSKLEEEGLEILRLWEWGWPFHSVYKFLLGCLSEQAQRKMGLGKYGLLKRTLSHVLFLLFYGNIFNRGQNIIVLRRPREARPR